MRLRYATSLFLLLVLMTVPTLAEYSLVAPPAPDDPMQVSIYRLDNGLEVYLSENHETPRFYTEIAVRAGSKHDPKETTGLAHYFEHLMFKGTARMGSLDYEAEKVHLDRIEELYEQRFRETDPEKRATLYKEIDAEAQLAAAYAIPNEMDQIYDIMGASMVNAHTGREETVYKVEVPSNRLRQWAALESDRFQGPIFRLFPTELETVYEEKNRSMDNKDRIIQEAVFKQLYKKHPYGQETVLGRIEHLKNPSIRNIQNFFHTWYAPNNMAIFISGDIDKEETMAVIDEYFSVLKAKPLPESKTWNEPPLKGREAVETQYEGEEFLMMAFPTVKRNHPDQEALMLLDMIMDNATAGLINLNLNQQQKVRQAGSFPYMQNDYGAQFFYGIPKDGQTLEDVEALILGELAKVKTGDFEDWIIPAIINDFKKNEKAALESDAARVGQMSQSWLSFTSWEQARGRIARMEQLTRDDVIRVANEYFGHDYVIGLRRDAPHEVPKVEKPPLTKVEIDPTRRSAFAAELLAMPVIPNAPAYIDPETDYTKIENDNGRTVYYAPNPINDIFTFSVTVDFGRHEDNTIGTAVALLEKSGTERLSPEALQKEWYKLGTNFGISAGDNETVVTLTGLDEHFAASLALLQEVLTQPKAAPETLERLKGILLIQREDAKKQAPSIHQALVQYNRYEADSTFLRMLPTEQLQALTVDELQTVIKGLLGYKHSISYTGSLPLETALAQVNEALPVTAALADPPPYRYLTARAPENTEIYFIHKEGAQAQIRLEFGSVTYDEALQPAIQLYNNYFSGGMSGLVFQELREARALAYIAGARYLNGYRKNSQDLMLGVIQTQPDKSIEATEAFIDLLDNMPASPDRFNAAQVSLINRYRTEKLGFREILGAIRTWERRDLTPDPRAARFEAIQSATMDTVMTFQQEHIASNPKLISIVGDKAIIDMEALAKIAPVKELSVDTVFVQ